jgi:chaperonin GroEL
MAKKIIFKDEARRALQKGINMVADCVKVTLGAKGRFVALDNEYSAPIITNDGVTIAKEVMLPNEFENMGSKFVYEASSKTNTDSGDGTTTAIVLTQALVNEGLKNLAAGANPILIKKGMESAAKDIIDYLESDIASKPIDSSEDIAKVATISSRDESYGKIIADIIEEVGKDVVISVEDSNTANTTYEVVKGLSFDSGYVAPHFVTNPEKMEAILNNPYILITDQRITKLQDILPLLESVSKMGEDLLIISDEISNEVLGTLVTNKLRGVLNVACVKPPKFGENREKWLEDIAIVTKGLFYNSKLNLTLSDLNIIDLGRAKTVKIDKNSTTIVDGCGEPEIIDSRCEALKNEMAELSNQFDKDNIKERIAKMQNGVAVIRVGANTEVELKDKKLRLEDALSATRSAIDEGIVAGGGVALLNASVELGNKVTDIEDETKVGYKIVLNAIQQPIKQIIANAGFDCNIAINDLIKKNIKNYGFDVSSGEYCDMFENGIIDPLKVTKSALQNAISIATMVLTTEVLIANDKDESE